MSSLSRDYVIPKVWPMNEKAIERAKPDNLLWFPPRARFVLRNMKRLAQARTAYLVTGVQLDPSMFLHLRDYDRLGPPQWTKVDPEHYRITQW